MDADLELVGGLTLQQKREIEAFVAPEPVRHPKRLQRDKTLVVQERWQQFCDGGIMLGDSLEIAGRSFDEVGCREISLAREFRELAALAGSCAEPLADLVRHRAGKIVVI